MAATISAAIAAAAAEASAFAANAAAIITGGNIAVDAAISEATYAVVAALPSLAINTALLILLAPRPPTEASKLSLKQSTASRRSAYGRVRTGGVYALHEAVGRWSYDVVCIHDGQIDGYEQFWLNDDQVTVVSNIVQALPGGAYGGNTLVRIYSRDGLSTETAYPEIIAGVPSIWTTDHRLDGIASIALACGQSSKKKQQKVFPNGLPSPGATYRGLRTYDPRENGITALGDPNSWLWSENGVSHIIDYITHPLHGMGFDFSRRIAPRIADWIQAANDCDELVALDAGGTEPRYRCGLTFDWTSAPVDVLAPILASFDGWLAPKGDGSYTIQAGVYRDPTVIFTDDHISGMTLRHFQTDEESVNELAPTFTDPNSNFNTVDAGVWQNDVDIAATGRIRSQPMALPAVPSASQARRLAKRQMVRQSAKLRGTIFTNWYGMMGLGERYIRLQSREIPDVNDVVIEILKASIDLKAGGLSFDWVAIETDELDAWDPSTDEQPLTSPTARPTQADLEAPTITSVTGIYDPASSADTGARLAITADSPIGAEVEWTMRWRVTGTTSWHETDLSDVDDGPSVDLVSGFVPATSDLDIQVKYDTAGGSSPWSATFTFTTVAPTTSFDDAVAALIASSVGPAALTFGLTDGSTGTEVTLPAVATRAGSFTFGEMEVVAADPSTALTLVIKKNGTSVFTAPPSLAGGTSPGLHTLAGLSSPVAFVKDDIFTLDITSGSALWTGTIVLG